MRCTCCGGGGWVLDCDPRKNPVALELIPCIRPDCLDSGKPVAVLSFKPFTDRTGVAFHQVARHPGTGALMSVTP